MKIRMTRKERREIHRLAVAYQNSKLKLRSLGAIITLAPTLIFLGLLIHGMARLLGIKERPIMPKVWIASPLGKTTKQLPLYQAMRIVRKYHWHYLETTPKLNRWGHLRAVIVGG